MDIDAHAALRLFKAIVSNALIDATTPPQPKALISAESRPVKRRKNENDIEYAARKKKTIERRVVGLRRDMDEAREWLLGNSADFREVVSLAGYDPDDIRERAEALAARDWPPAPKAAMRDAA